MYWCKTANHFIPRSSLCFLRICSIRKAYPFTTPKISSGNIWTTRGNRKRSDLQNKNILSLQKKAFSLPKQSSDCCLPDVFQTNSLDPDQIVRYGTAYSEPNLFVNFASGGTLGDLARVWHRNDQLGSYISKYYEHGKRLGPIQEFY